MEIYPKVMAVYGENEYIIVKRGLYPGLEDYEAYCIGNSGVLLSLYFGYNVLQGVTIEDDTIIIDDDSVVYYDMPHIFQRFRYSIIKDKSFDELVIWINSFIANKNLVNGHIIRRMLNTDDTKNLKTTVRHLEKSFNSYLNLDADKILIHYLYKTFNMSNIIDESFTIQFFQPDYFKELEDLQKVVVFAQTRIYDNKDYGFMRRSK